MGGVKGTGRGEYMYVGLETGGIAFDFLRFLLIRFLCLGS